MVSSADPSYLTVESNFEQVALKARVRKGLCCRDCIGWLNPCLDCPSSLVPFLFSVSFIQDFHVSMRWQSALFMVIHLTLYSTFFIAPKISGNLSFIHGGERSLTRAWHILGISFNLVAFLFGPATLASNIVYAIIGIAALIWLIWMLIDRPVNRNER